MVHTITNASPFTPSRDQLRRHRHARVLPRPGAPAVHCLARHVDRHGRVIGLARRVDRRSTRRRDAPHDGVHMAHQCAAGVRTTDHDQRGALVERLRSAGDRSNRHRRSAAWRHLGAAGPSDVLDVHLQEGGLRIDSEVTRADSHRRHRRLDYARGLHRNNVEVCKHHGVFGEFGELRRATPPTATSIVQAATTAL